MQKSRIEWTDYTWNPITGCSRGCTYCYARKMAENPFYEKAFPNKFEPTFYPERLKEIENHAGAKIFVCSMGELFANEHEKWTREIIDRIKLYPHTTFQLLTKQPQNLPKWSPFPDNCQVGVSLDFREDQYKHYIGVNPYEALDVMKRIEAKVKFFSFEPLLNDPFVGFHPRWWAEQFIKSGINWLIVGACTGSKAEIMELRWELRKLHPDLTPMATEKKNRWILAPKVEWIREIVEAADKVSVPVFLKNNLKELILTEGIKHKALEWALDNHGYLRQEFPRIKEEAK